MQIPGAASRARRVIQLKFNCAFRNKVCRSRIAGRRYRKEHRRSRYFFCDDKNEIAIQINMERFYLQPKENRTRNVYGSDQSK